MPELLTINMRIATSHPLPAYGGVQLSEEVLHQLAEAVASGSIPMRLEHDPAKPLSGHCLSAKVVDLPDGYKAVDAVCEVDADTWHAYQLGLAAVGAPGGMSFSATEHIAQVPPFDPAAEVRLGLYGDAAHFTDEDLVDAAEVLAAVGTVEVGRLLQFSYVPSCRIIVEYVHESGGLSATSMAVSIGLNLIASTIFAALIRLLSRRPAVHPRVAEPAEIEIHRTTAPGGVTVQTLKITTNNEDVLQQALERLIEPAQHPEWGVAVWDADQRLWRQI